MVAANQSCKKAGVWIGTGNTKKGQVSFIDLNTDGHTYEVGVKLSFITNSLALIDLMFLYLHIKCILTVGYSFWKA